MGSLYYQLDIAAWQLEKSAEKENAKVRKRVAKICRELRDLREYVLNAAKPVDFIVDVMEYFRRPPKRRVLCAKCRKDITLSGGYVFPQEPKKYYCCACETEHYHRKIEEFKEEIENEQS